MSQNSSERLEALRTTELFGRLPESILWTVVASSTVRNLTRGEILYSEQEEASALYFVVRGQLRSIRMNVEGREQVLSTEPPGAILAAVALFERCSCNPPPLNSAARRRNEATKPRYSSRRSCSG